MPKTDTERQQLTLRQEMAVVELLTGDIPRAAAAAKVSERTVFRWLREPAFKEAYREARREAVSQATARLQKACSQAVECLEGVMRDIEAPASARVSAAKAVLEMAVKGVEIEDLAVRLETLEEAFKKERGAR